MIDELISAATPGLVATTGPRYFGFVIGGALDSATAADMLATGWDQPAYNALSSPAAAIAEEAAGEWLKQLLGLPATASFGFVTGAQGANTVGLAAARHHVLSAAGHVVERDGLIGAPRSTRCWFGAGSDAERDATTDRVIDAVQRSGECWMGATTWHGMRLMRISVSSWLTTEADVDRSVAAILDAPRRS